MSDAEIEAIEKFGTPSHILLTCNWHLREGEAYRERWGCKIYVNELGVAEAETPIDGTFRHGERLWDVVEVIHLPDVYWKEETAFLVHRENGLLIIGDAVCGGRADVGIPDGEVGIHDMNYVPDREKARMSLARLMNYPFDAICFGHGSPILHGAKAALQRFIDTGLS
jgi:glyoxylase-like metal-dependent hydrolase (beta-lactamase superfamily II)